MFNWQKTCLETYRSGSHDFPPQSLSHRMCRQPKSSGQSYLVLGFIIVSMFLIFRTTHQESARWNPRELHANAVGKKRSDWLHATYHQAAQAIFQLAAVRNFDGLRQRVQQPDQLATGIATLFQPV